MMKRAVDFENASNATAKSNRNGHKDVERLLACPKQQQRPNHTSDQACRKQHHHPAPLADEIAALGERPAEVSRTQCNGVRDIRDHRRQPRCDKRWK